jgi:hypothetical protein
LITSNWKNNPDWIGKSKTEKKNLYEWEQKMGDIIDNSRLYYKYQAQLDSKPHIMSSEELFRLRDDQK